MESKKFFDRYIAVKCPIQKNYTSLLDFIMPKGQNTDAKLDYLARHCERHMVKGQFAVARGNPE